uniref:Uncharacterized protein n=1 Tax=Anguilla anguilla TaxID=7936 RepID=A0A0E9VEI0_ANGAN
MHKRHSWISQQQKHSYWPETLKSHMVFSKATHAQTELGAKYDMRCYVLVDYFTIRHLPSVSA